jgi:predicted metal-dependent hydrolase
MSAEVLEANFGSETIRFSVVRRVRKTLSISVLPNQQVEVFAPEDASSERIIEKVRNRAPWICKQLRYYDQFQPKTPERRYIGQCKLKVMPGIRNSVKMQRGQLIVLSTKPDRTMQTRELVRGWMLQRAQIKFAERLGICRRRFPDPEKVIPSSVIIRELSSRWGSMTGRRNLVLNRALIGASTESIDYVITHELCHIDHPHHGSAFFNQLKRVMPDWEKRKSKLERQLA